MAVKSNLQKSSQYVFVMSQPWGRSRRCFQGSGVAARKSQIVDIEEAGKSCYGSRHLALALTL